MLPANIENIISKLPTSIQELVAKVIAIFTSQLAEKDARIAELEARLSKNSRNSSKPPSTDAVYNKPCPQNSRKKSKKKVGGQKKHKGSTLKRSSNPDDVKTYEVESCSCCGKDLSNQKADSVQCRQVYDIPPMKLKVTEHQGEIKKCSCGHKNQAAFPAGVNHYVQYGANLKGLVVYLQNYQLLPYGRTVEMIEDLFQHHLSAGTLNNIQRYAFERLADFEEQLKTLLTAAAVAGFDETGFRVLSKCWWLHSCSTDQHAYYEVHKQRGNDAMDAIGILPHFTGIAIHDFWKSYLKYDCTHGLCNAHLLRELKFVHEKMGQAWAGDLATLLCKMKEARDRAVKKQKQGLAQSTLKKYQRKYTQIVKQGLEANPFTPPKKKGKRKAAKTKPRNLLERFRDYKTDIIRFLYDFKVPFDNNFSERDIRMMKLKQKISGCFRSKKGADYFARIRSYIMTARKQGYNAFEVLVNLFEDNNIYSKLVNSS